MKQKPQFVALACSALAISCRHTPESGVRAVTLGRLPSLHGAAAVAEVKPLMGYLERSLGVPVEIVEPRSYREMTKSLAEHRIDVAYLGGVGFTRAEQYGYDAAVVLQRNGSRLQRGLIFTRADTAITRLQELKGKKVAFVEEGSTTGWDCPLATLYAAGIRPKDITWSFLGGHDAVVKAVLLDRTFDAGACYEAAIDATLPDRPDLTKPVVVLARTSAVPNGVLAVWRDAPHAKELVAALRAVGAHGDAKSIIAPFQADAFVEPDPSDFDAARSIDLLVSEVTGE